MPLGEPIFEAQLPASEFSMRSEVRFSDDDDRLIVAQGKHTFNVIQLAPHGAALSAKAREIVASEAPASAAPAAPEQRLRLGVITSDISPTQAQRLGLPSTAGAVIVELQPASPAEEAGLRVQDVIVSFDGTAITNKDDVPVAVRRTGAGSDVAVAIVRNGKAEQVKVRLRE